MKMPWIRDFPFQEVEPLAVGLELRATDNLVVALHLLANLVLLHLGGVLQALGHGLGRESLLPCPLHAVAHEAEVFGYQHGGGRQERE